MIGLKLGLSIGSGKASGRKMVSIPANFRWNPSFKIYEQNGVYETDIDYTSLRPTGVVKYFSKAGNDSSDGNTPATAYRTLEKGRTVNANVYMIGAGFWDRSDGFSAANFAPNGINVAFVAYEGAGTVNLSRAYSGLSWVQQSDPNGSVYLTTAATLEAVIDLTDGQVGRYLADGSSLVPKKLTSVASVAACQALAGSYYYTGTSLYVHTWDGRAPDSNIKVLSTEGFMWFTYGTTQTFGYEGCNLFGRRFARLEHTAVNNNTFYMLNCNIHCGGESSMAAIRVQGTKNVYVKNFKASDHPLADSCSLSMGEATVAQTAPPNGIFENIETWNHGSGTANNYNAFTAHQGANMIVLNSRAENFYGPLYAFVEGAHALVFGAYGKTSLATVATAQKSIYQTGDVNPHTGDRTKVWFKNYTADGSENFARSNASGLADFYNCGGYLDLTVGTTKGLSLIHI